MPGHKQSQWDRPLLNEVLSSLEERLQDPYDQATIKASQSRLGVAICEPHVCACGTQVSSRGAHGLSCSLGFGRQARQSSLNDIIHRSLNRAGIPAIKEPS